MIGRKGPFNRWLFLRQGFSNNGHLTIATVDPRNQELIGQREGLSHRDKHLANLMYGCIGQCFSFALFVGLVSNCWR